MKLIFEERRSDSPFIDTVWRTQSEGPGAFTSVAVSNWEMVVMRQRGVTTFTVRGPETIATPAAIPEDAEFFGIKFKLGTFMLPMPVGNLVDAPINLPDATSKSFWLNGS